MRFEEVNQSNIALAGKIHSESWQESHRSFCSPSFVAQHTPQVQEQYLLQQICAGKHIYMLIDQYPVGIVSVDGSVIENLYVLPSEQRKGYGTQLLQYAAAHCGGAPRLWVLNTNEAAIRLYRKNGFRFTGARIQRDLGMYELDMICGEEEA